MKKFAKLFKNTNIRIAFEAINATRNSLKLREETIDMYNQSGIYQLKYNECSLKCTGQRRCTFKF
jgi:hypothetical protein